MLPCGLESRGDKTIVPPTRQSYEPSLLCLHRRRQFLDVPFCVWLDSMEIGHVGASSFLWERSKTPIHTTGFGTGFRERFRVSNVVKTVKLGISVDYECGRQRRAAWRGKRQRLPATRHGPGYMQQNSQIQLNCGTPHEIPCDGGQVLTNR